MIQLLLLQAAIFKAAAGVLSQGVPVASVEPCCLFSPPQSPSRTLRPFSLPPQLSGAPRWLLIVYRVRSASLQSCTSVLLFWFHLLVFFFFFSFSITPSRHSHTRTDPTSPRSATETETIQERCVSLQPAAFHLSPSSSALLHPSLSSHFPLLLVHVCTHGMIKYRGFSSFCVCGSEQRIFPSVSSSLTSSFYYSPGDTFVFSPPFHFFSGVGRPLGGERSLLQPRSVVRSVARARPPSLTPAPA